MSLRSVAEQDLKFIVEDEFYGFAYLITITSPAGVMGSLLGFSNDVAQLIDVDTGQAVSGRVASAVLRISSLIEASLGLPIGVSDTTSKPWIVEFEDINGNPFKFKVTQSNPDRALGIVSLILELYV